VEGRKEGLRREFTVRRQRESALLPQAQRAVGGIRHAPARRPSRLRKSYARRALFLHAYAAPFYAERALRAAPARCQHVETVVLFARDSGRQCRELCRRRRRLQLPTTTDIHGPRTRGEASMMDDGRR